MLVGAASVPAVSPPQTSTRKVYLLEATINKQDQWCAFGAGEAWEAAANKLRPYDTATLSAGSGGSTEIALSQSDESGDWVSYDQYTLDGSQQVVALRRRINAAPGESAIVQSFAARDGELAMTKTQLLDLDTGKSTNRAPDFIPSLPLYSESRIPPLSAILLAAQGVETGNAAQYCVPARSRIEKTSAADETGEVYALEVPESGAWCGYSFRVRFLGDVQDLDATDRGAAKYGSDGIGRITYVQSSRAGDWTVNDVYSVVRGRLASLHRSITISSRDVGIDETYAIRGGHATRLSRRAYSPTSGRRITSVAEFEPPPVITSLADLPFYSLVTTQRRQVLRSGKVCLDGAG